MGKIKNKLSSFRMYVTDHYMRANDERLVYSERKLSLKEYTDRYKWWLKNKFKKGED